MNRLAIHKEKLKTILLVVLFVSAVLLSYLYWQDVTFSGIKDSVNSRLSSGVFVSKENPEINDLICPNASVYSDDGETISILQKDTPELWNIFIKGYNSLSKSDNISIEEISENIWLDAMSGESLQFTFSYNLPVEYLRLIGADDCGEREYINSIRTIGCSESSPTSVFIQDASQHKYFRIASEFKIGGILDKAQNMKGRTSNQCYPADMLFGTDNTALIPFTSNISLDPLTAPALSDVSSSEVRLAESFFGNGLDFIRKITDDNGTIVYMYGMGEKILTIYNNGTYEYQEKSNSDKEDLSLKKALTLASDFISEHGGWSDSSGEKVNTILSSMKVREKSKVKSYVFEFETKYDNCPISGSDITGIKIEITGGQITGYSRGIENIRPEGQAKDPSSDSQKVGRINSSVYDIIAENYGKIYKLLSIENQPEELSEMYMFDTVVERISDVTAGYYCSGGTDVHSFRPAWIIDFTNVKAYFDIYSGEYLGYADER